MNTEMKQATFGDIVTWTIHNAFIERDALITAFKTAGIPVAIKKTKPSTYLRRALQQAVEEGAVIKIGEDAKCVAYAVVSEDKDLKHSKYSSEMKEAVKLYKDTGQLEFKYSTDLTRDIREAVKKNEGGLLSNEVGGLCKEVIARVANGIPLRTMGGVYFVPASSCSVLDNLEQTLKSVANAKARIHINRFRVLSGAREASDLASVFKITIEKELKNIQEEAAVLKSDLAKARPSTFAKRMQTVRGRLDAIAQYKDLLEVDFTKLVKEANNTGRMLRDARKECIEARAVDRAEQHKHSSTKKK